MKAALVETSVIMRCMAYCDLCDMNREFCEHGLADRRRNVVASVSKLLISPNGIAHFPGCPHEGDHQDYRKWADLEGLTCTGRTRTDLRISPGRR